MGHFCGDVIFEWPLSHFITSIHSASVHRSGPTVQGSHVCSRPWPHLSVLFPLCVTCSERTIRVPGEGREERLLCTAGLPVTDFCHSYRSRVVLSYKSDAHLQSEWKGGRIFCKAHSLSVICFDSFDFRYFAHRMVCPIGLCFASSRRLLLYYFLKVGLKVVSLSPHLHYIPF